jgi:sugar phosphate isomerase/epimerase
VKIAVCDTAFQMTLDRTFEVARNLGFDGVEMTLGGRRVQDHPIWSRAGLRGLRDSLIETRVPVASLYLQRFERLGFAHPDEKIRANAWRLYRALIGRVLDIGAGALAVPLDARVVAPAGPFRDIAVESIRRASEAVNGSGIALLVRVSADPPALLSFLGDVAREDVGLEYDVAARALAGNDPASEIEALGENVHQVRVLDIGEDREPRPLGLGTVNIPSVVRALYEVDYGGYLVVDPPPSDDPVATAAASLAFLKDALLTL